MTKTVTRRSVLAVAAYVGFAPTVIHAQALKPEYKLSVVGNVPLGTAVAAHRWADLVRERTQTRINIKVYPGSQLVGGDQNRELTAMRQGVIDMVVSSTISIAPQIREMNLFSLPFMMPDADAFDALTQSGSVRAALDTALAQRGVIALAWSENGFRQLSNSKRAVRRPQDMKGLKIRFAAGSIYSDIFSALGANPLQMSWADLQPALATGAVDGQETPVNVFLQTKLDTLGQKHLSLWNYVADANIFKVNQAVWESFSSTDRDVLRACAEQAAREHTESTRRGLGANGDRSSLDELAKRNVTVAALSQQEKATFAQATRSVYDKWASTTGIELVRLAETAIKKIS